MGGVQQGSRRRGPVAELERAAADITGRGSADEVEVPKCELPLTAAAGASVDRGPSGRHARWPRSSASRPLSSLCAS